MLICREREPVDKRGQYIEVEGLAEKRIGAQLFRVEEPVDWRSRDDHHRDAREMNSSWADAAWNGSTGPR